MTRPAVWIARHAPVAVRGLCYGRTDVLLEIDHEAAATRVASQWRQRGLEVPRLWASPAARARGLAEAIAARLGASVSIDPRLSEISFGAWEGRAYAEIEANDGARFQAWMNDWARSAPPGGEAVPALVQRAAAWWSAVGEGPVLAITHAGPIRALRALARGVAYPDVASEPVEYLSLERIALR